MTEDVGLVKRVVPEEDMVVEKEKTASLIEMAIHKDFDADRLAQLIALVNQQEDRAAKKEFDLHFAEMQKEFEPLPKSKQGYSSKYAPIDALQKKYGPIISEHGFSCRWREESLGSGGKRVVIIISGYGHTDDKTFFDVPKLEATQQQNAIQVLGAMSTYGRRYTFKAGFGITEEDEDTDGNFTQSEILQYAVELQAMKDAETMDELKETWVSLVEPTFRKADRAGQELLARAKDTRKKELSA